MISSNYFLDCEGERLLCQSIIIQCAKDLIDRKKNRKKEVNEFLGSNWFRSICNGLELDPSFVISLVAKYIRRRKLLNRSAHQV